VCNYVCREKPKIKHWLLKALLPVGYIAGFLSPFYSRSLHIQISVVFMAATLALLLQEISLIKRDKE